MGTHRLLGWGQEADLGRGRRDGWGGVLTVSSCSPPTLVLCLHLTVLAWPIKCAFELFDLFPVPPSLNVRSKRVSCVSFACSQGSHDTLHTNSL